MHHSLHCISYQKFSFNYDKASMVGLLVKQETRKRSYDERTQLVLYIIISISCEWKKTLSVCNEMFEARNFTALLKWLFRKLIVARYWHSRSKQEVLEEHNTYMILCAWLEVWRLKLLTKFTVLHHGERTKIRCFDKMNRLNLKNFLY